VLGLEVGKYGIFYWSPVSIFASRKGAEAQLNMLSCFFGSRTFYGIGLKITRLGAE
jgi:hypothetical protein